MLKKSRQEKYDYTDAELKMHGVSGMPEIGIAKKEKFSGNRFTRFLLCLRDMLKKISVPVLKQLRKLISVHFLVMLVVSFTLWYAIKLGYTYQSEVPFNVEVAGHEFRIKCVVEGQGARLFARRFYGNNDIVLDWRDLDVSTSAVNTGAVVISPYSLQNAISAQSTDIKILSVGPIPEIIL